MSWSYLRGWFIFGEQRADGSSVFAGGPPYEYRPDDVVDINDGDDDVLVGVRRDTAERIIGLRRDLIQAVDNVIYSTDEKRDHVPEHRIWTTLT